jgi:hypothetical protein
MLLDALDAFPATFPVGASAIIFTLCFLVCLSSLSTQDTSANPFAGQLMLTKIPSWLQRRYKAWIFLFRGPRMIADAYNKSRGSPFFVDVPENRYWVVSNWKHINEINSAPETVLSLQGAAKEILQPKHTMEGFDWLEKKGADGAPLLKSIGVLLTSYLPELLPNLRYSISAFFQDYCSSYPENEFKRRIPLYPMVIGAVARSNALAFFGKGLAQNETFMKAGMDMVEHTLIIAEIVRLLPKAIADPFGKFLSQRLNSSKVVMSMLEPLVEERFEERARAQRGIPPVEHKDCIQWIMDTSPKSKPWTVRRVVHELVALWFGSVHITSTTACFALFDLCLRPEYVEPLRKEFEATGWESFESSGGNSLPLLDSFMKESARFTPVESGMSYL